MRVTMLMQSLNNVLDQNNKVIAEDIIGYMREKSWRMGYV